MKRVGAALVLLAGCLAILVGLLVDRALESASIERAVRHRAVADRSFDEMERTLSRFLEREEARPFSDYRFYVEGGSGAQLRSPLSRDPDQPFVLGYFQIDPDGSLHSPLRPRDPDLARRRGDWDVDDDLFRVEATLEEAWRRARRPAPRPLARASLGKDAQLTAGAPAPATEPLSAAQSQRGEEGSAQRDEATQSAFDVLRMLNRAPQLRAERKQKVVEEPLSKVYADTGAQREAEGASLADGLGSSHSARPRASAAGISESAARAPDKSEHWAAKAGGGRKRGGAPEPAEAALESERPEDKRQRHVADKGAGEATVRVALDPMVGRSGGEGYLVLYRTVLVGEQGYRQGLLIDWRKLGSWLEREVLEVGGLGQLARVSFQGPEGDDGDRLARSGELQRNPEGDDTSRGTYVFRHRFGEPFETLGVRLSLEPLPGVGSTAPIYLLAGLLALAAAGGLAAVYRMVSVVVQFAERRNNFVSAVSHELKTPLTSIRMYGEMLRDGLVSSESKRGEYYRTITDESERLSRLINNVLEFSRLEKGQRDLHLARGSLAALLREVALQLRPHAESQGFRLELELERSLPALDFDRDAVIQVVFNLVDNALKYARTAARKEIQLTCRLRGDRALLRVRDYGPGVPRRHLSRVFEAFYRGEDELTRTTKGTGIGLALVKELVESMGASISAANLEPKEGGGFAVQIAFPLEGTQKPAAA